MRARTLWHVWLAVLSWTLFGYYWWLVAQRRLNPHTIVAVSTLTALAALVFLATLVWIWHNRRLAHRLGARRAQRPLPPDPLTTDALGRPLALRGGSPLVLAPYVVVELDKPTGAKCYIAWSEPPAGEVLA